MSVAFMQNAPKLSKNVYVMLKVQLIISVFTMYPSLTLISYAKAKPYICTIILAYCMHKQCKMYLECIYCQSSLTEYYTKN